MTVTGQDTPQAALLKTHKASDTINIEIDLVGTTQMVAVTLGEQPAS